MTKTNTVLTIPEPRKVALKLSVATIFDGIALKIVDGSRHTPE